MEDVHTGALGNEELREIGIGVSCNDRVDGVIHNIVERHSNLVQAHGQKVGTADGPASYVRFETKERPYHKDSGLPIRGT